MQSRRNQIALWTFEGAPLFEEGKPIIPEFASIHPVPQMVMYNQNIDDDGKSGKSYVDVNGTPHSQSRAASWKDIRGKGPDADLYITFSTRGWREIRIRFDYRAESADSFDVAVRTSEDDEWERVINNQHLTPDYAWHATEIDLGITRAVNDCKEVTVRLYDFDRHGNDRLVLDNMEITGIRMDGEVNPIRITDLPQGIAAVIDAEKQPPYHNENGWLFHVSDPDTALSSLRVSVESLDNDVLNDAHVVPIDPSQGVYMLEVGKPAGKIGLTMLVVKASNAHGMASQVMIPYGASKASSGETYFIGTSDVSAGIGIGQGWMLVGVDEDNILRVYPREGPSQEVMQIPLVDAPDSHPLYLTQVKRSGEIREMDIEAAARLHNRVFWMCSHSNNDDGDLRPNRERLFATDLWIREGYVHLQVVGYYDNLREDLSKWGDEHDIDMADTMEEGVGAKEKDGFNIEGFTISPDGTTALIGFRVPFVEVDDKDYALIVPIQDFAQWFNNGHPVRPPQLGDPIRLNLGGRGVRAMQCSEYGCLIVAGPADEDGTFALFTWSGDPDDQPQQRAADLTGMRPECIVAPLEDEMTADSEIQLLSDNGDTDWYDTGEESADLIHALQKFRSDVVRIGEVVETTAVDD